MHAELEKRRRAARERRARRQGVILQTYSEGNFVLVATATGCSGNKLALNWRGPKRIIRATDFTFEVQDIIPPLEVSVRHASRLHLPSRLPPEPSHPAMGNSREVGRAG
ncbi:uncharacterized protein PITG_19048 [Phytophthora infestans T30-4]|uniref:Uncharacterized protein n=1 Tax=Phytophthora infestans (strain T30-4) TaxID=403677 RepID=D0NZV1_PHYIT|nr:uncharacterized protein PITG_19048 [Phytophthora infestans T30-4]EEY69667.1 hypothetical protein PITG_19048 [Phytophthora infestans T30-4]|eukprot:XP_002997119.1 hypothetical protein PITG_19048 [Phytophthora infestans T30-4]